MDTPEATVPRETTGRRATTDEPSPTHDRGEATVHEATARPFREVVYVWGSAPGVGGWFCTGTLVASDTVVTAAHCLRGFGRGADARFDVTAPLVDGTPKVRARDPRVFGGPFEDVANPDIGLLTLDEPIALDTYATLTDVASRVEAGEALSGTAVVRTADGLDAPLGALASMPISSTVSLGYEHGFGTPMFSRAGDSGAGLFLVEEGQTTHKLVGVARQPEPARDLDHFTRIDAAFLEWRRGRAN